MKALVHVLTTHHLRKMIEHVESGPFTILDSSGSTFVIEGTNDDVVSLLSELRHKFPLTYVSGYTFI